MMKTQNLLSIGALAFALALTGCANNKHAKRGTGTDLASVNANDGDELGPCGVRVHFEYDSSEIPEHDRPALASSARCLKEDRGMKARIEGNADERGTEEYNLALGDRRATTVSKYLMALGADDKQLIPVSFGEENPVCTNHEETCWKQNRRAAVRPRTSAEGTQTATKEDK